MPGTRAGIVLLVVVALAGCGDGKTGLSDGQQRGLLAQLEAVRASAATDDVAGTAKALRSFRVSVARLQREHALTPSQARDLRLGAVRILARVRQAAAPQPEPAPVQTQTQTAPAPTPPPGQAKKHGKEKKPKGHGHGKKGKKD